MRKITPLEPIAGVAATMLAAGPAFAGTPPTPAPVLGAGIGAILVIGAGYRALKRHIDR
jgi:hypothetical protein